MLKLAIFVLVAATHVQASATWDYTNEIIEATKAGDLAKVQVLFSEIHRLNVINLQNQLKAANPISADAIKDLKPVPGGHVYGEAESTFHSWSNVDGQTTTQGAGHKVINDDGRVTEFNFKPDPNTASIKGVLQNNPVLIENVKNLKPVPGGHVYGEAEKTFTSATSINGQTTIQAGGHKVINNNGQVTEYDLKPNNPAITANVSQVAPLNIQNQAPVAVPLQTGPVSNPIPSEILIQTPINHSESASQASAPIPGLATAPGAPNVQTSYYSTSSNTKSQTVHTSGDVENNANLSELKKAIQQNITPEGVKTLQPISGGHVFGEAEKTYYTWMTVDGKTTIQTQGHKVVNNNGKVTEYDFKPTPNKDLSSVQGLIQSANLSAEKIKNLKPLPGGHVYGEAENNFQTWANVNGQTFEKSGGHKVVNDDGKVTEYALQPNQKS